MANRSTDLATRVAWKYACGTRHIYETPTFYINGFKVIEPTSANKGTANITDWVSMIDPLLATVPTYPRGGLQPLDLTETATGRL